MEVGDYVRDKDGNIDKFIGKRENRLFKSNALTSFASVMEVNAYENDNIKNTITKSSPDITDLIKVGDVYKKIYPTGLIEIIPINKFEDLYNIKIDIKNGFKVSIVTKEQFESMEYKV